MHFLQFDFGDKTFIEAVDWLKHLQVSNGQKRRSVFREEINIPRTWWLCKNAYPGLYRRRICCIMLCPGSTAESYMAKYHKEDRPWIADKADQVCQTKQIIAIYALRLPVRVLRNYPTFLQFKIAPPSVDELYPPLPHLLASAKLRKSDLSR